jgi:hypothetical protein
MQRGAHVGKEAIVKRIADQRVFELKVACPFLVHQIEGTHCREAIIDPSFVEHGGQQLGIEPTPHHRRGLQECSVLRRKAIHARG